MLVQRPGKTLCKFTLSERCEICRFDCCENSKTRQLKAKEIERKVPFSDWLKNSSTLSNWIDQEKRVVGIVSKVEHDSENFKTSNPVLWADLGNLRVKYWSTKDELKNEFELYLPLLKEKHQSERRQAPRKLNSESKNDPQNDVITTIILNVLGSSHSG